jgi:hypothetical protein
VIAAALATKLATVPGINLGISVPEDSPPSTFPFVVIEPPDFKPDEEGSYVDAYEATFTAWIAFSLEGGSAQMIREAYLIRNGLQLAFRSGRRLGLESIIRNSYISDVSGARVTYWDEPGYPGLAVEIVVELAETHSGRTD